ncbi:MAG: hypothetical protein IJQ98_12660, partial [Oscillospiraceae bacterium]|nr:hypothetical protein [Oscillospiraceae bacterium]
MLSHLTTYELHASPDTEITRLTDESRTVACGALFAALHGAKEDGASYLADALARGAACALAGRECREHAFRTCGILFDCTRGNVITVEHFKYWLRRLA